MNLVFEIREVMSNWRRKCLSCALFKSRDFTEIGNIYIYIKDDN